MMALQKKKYILKFWNFNITWSIWIDDQNHGLRIGSIRETYALPHNIVLLIQLGIGCGCSILIRKNHEVKALYNEK